MRYNLFTHIPIPQYVLSSIIFLIRANILVLSHHTPRFSTTFPSQGAAVRDSSADLRFANLGHSSPQSGRHLLLHLQRRRSSHKVLMVLAMYHVISWQISDGVNGSCHTVLCFHVMGVSSLVKHSSTNVSTQTPPRPLRACWVLAR